MYTDNDPVSLSQKWGAVFAWNNGVQWVLQAQMYIWPWVQVHGYGNLEIWGVSPQSTGKERQFTMRATDTSFCNSSFLYLFKYYESPGNACGILDSGWVDGSMQNQVCNLPDMSYHRYNKFAVKLSGHCGSMSTIQGRYWRWVIFTGISICHFHASLGTTKN